MRTDRYVFSRAETLDFLQTHIGELRSMAMGSRLDLISYLLELAYIELGDTIRKERPFCAKSQVMSVGAKIVG